jgi:hypothetical protein
VVVGEVVGEGGGEGWVICFVFKSLRAPHMTPYWVRRND